MATQQTANRGYPYPTTSETPNVPRDLEALATALDADVNALVPVGTIIAHAGSSVPSGWLLCNGSTFSGAVYPALFTTLGYTSGQTAYLPNLTDRFLKGSATARATGGSKTITVANMPSHNHGGATGGMSANATHNHTGTTTTDGSHAHAYNFTQGPNAKSAGSVSGALFSTSADVTSSNGAHNHDFTTATKDLSHTHSVASQGGGADYEPQFYTVRYLIRAS